MTDTALGELDKKFDDWVKIINDYLESHLDGIKFSRTKLTVTNHYQLLKFYPELMKFDAKRDDGAEGRVIVNIYEVEAIANKLNKNKPKNKETQKMVEPNSSNEQATEVKATPKKEPKVSISKVIFDFVEKNPGCTYEQIEEVYKNCGKVLKSGTLKSYLKSYVDFTKKSGKYAFVEENNQYTYTKK